MRQFSIRAHVTVITANSSWKNLNQMTGIRFVCKFAGGLEAIIGVDQVCSAFG